MIIVFSNGRYCDLTDNNILALVTGHQDTYPLSLQTEEPLDDKKLAIQGLGLLESRAEVPLGFDTNVSNRTYTIAVSAVEGKLRDAEIILRDHYLNMNHDLRNSIYVFEQVDQGSFQDRFSLAFTKEVELESDTDIEKDQFVVYNDGDTFRIQASESVETVRMYDILGNMILENHPRNTSFEIVEPSSKRGDVLLLQIIQGRFCLINYD